MDNKHIRNWYYILPDGSKAENMKEACEMMHINRRSFQNLVKKETIKKVLISKLKEDGKIINNE